MASNNVKEIDDLIKIKAAEELSKITGGIPLPPGFKWPF